MVSGVVQTGRPRLLWGILAGVGVLSILAVGLGLLAFRLTGSPPLDQFAQATAELKTRDLGPGFHPGVNLASPFRSLTPSDKVDVFRTADGRLLVLFKTSAGWKGNYTGYVYADGGLTDADLAPDAYGRPTVRMSIPAAGAPVLGKKLNDHCSEVFFDLG